MGASPPGMVTPPRAWLQFNEARIPSSRAAG